MRKIFNCVSYWVLRLWYSLLIIASTIYVIKHFDTIRDFTFFCDFNGDNLIFVLWLVLLIFPLFDSFEGFGISLKRRRQEQVEKLNQEVAQKADEAIKPSGIMDFQQLENYLREVEEKSGER